MSERSGDRPAGKQTRVCCSSLTIARRIQPVNDRVHQVVQVVADAVGCPSEHVAALASGLRAANRPQRQHQPLEGTEPRVGIGRRIGGDEQVARQSAQLLRRETQHISAVARLPEQRVQTTALRVEAWLACASSDGCAAK